MSPPSSFSDPSVGLRNSLFPERVLMSSELHAKVRALVDFDLLPEDCFDPEHDIIVIVALPSFEMEHPRLEDCAILMGPARAISPADVVQAISSRFRLDCTGVDYSQFPRAGELHGNVPEGSLVKLWVNEHLTLKDPFSDHGAPLVSFVEPDDGCMRLFAFKAVDFVTTETCNKDSVDIVRDLCPPRTTFVQSGWYAGSVGLRTFNGDLGFTDDTAIVITED